jgi:hypothetical protein
MSWRSKMRRASRAALWSYVLVTVGCTPAVVSTPEPELAADAVRFSRAGSSERDTLSIIVRGPQSVRKPSTVAYTVMVKNGTAHRYYYWWFVASCAKGGGCAPSSYVAFAEGEGQASASVRFGAESAEKDIVVQVAEIDGRGRTGASLEFPVTGPAQRQGGGTDGFSGGPVCDWYAGSFYPHTGIYTDPFTARSWERNFRRDYCGNRVSWDPEQ